MQSNSADDQVSAKWWQNVLAGLVDNILDPRDPRFRTLEDPPDWLPAWGERWLRGLPGPHSYIAGLPALYGVASMLCQGGMLAEFDLASRLTWPLVVQSMSLAGTGGGKTTMANLLRETLLQPGIGEIGAEMEWWAEQAEARGASVAGVIDGEDWRTVFIKPVRHLLLRRHDAYLNIGPASSGTSEGIRKYLQMRGSFYCLMTEENDLLREISAYKQRGTQVPLELFMKGWDRDTLYAVRAGQELSPLQWVQLPIVAAVQPEIFATATSDRQFTTSGFLPRFLLTEHIPNPAAPDGDDTDLSPPSVLVAACRQMAKGCAIPRIASTVYNALSDRIAGGDPVAPAFLGWDNSWDWVRGWALSTRAVQVEMTDGDRQGLRMIHNVLSQARPVRDYLVGRDGDDGVLSYPAPWMAGFGTRFVNYTIRLSVLSWLLDGCPAGEKGSASGSAYCWTAGEIAVVPRAYLVDTVSRVMPFFLGQWLWIMSDRVFALERQAAAENIRTNPKMRSQVPSDRCGQILLEAYRSGTSMAAKRKEWTTREAAVEVYKVMSDQYGNDDGTVGTNEPSGTAVNRVRNWLDQLVQDGWLTCTVGTARKGGGQPPKVWALTDKALSSSK